MTEARRLKTGRWRLYRTPDLSPLRDPETGTIPSFDSLAAARRWWAKHYPKQNPPQEAIKCAKCGTYFGRSSTWTLSGGLYYHVSHAPDIRRVKTPR